MFIQHLRRRQIEILLRHMYPPLPQRIHPRLRAHPLQLRPAASVHLLRDLREIYSSCQVHRAGVDSEDIRARFDGWRGEFYFPIDAAWAEERRVKDIEAVGRHDDFDVLCGFEAVELVEEFEHRALDFAVAARTAFHARGPDAVDLVHEDYAGGVLARHDEQFPHHAAAFADVFLDEF